MVEGSGILPRDRKAKGGSRGELRCCLGGLLPEAELLQRLDPARGIFGHAGRLVIEPQVAILRVLYLTILLDT